MFSYHVFHVGSWRENVSSDFIVVIKNGQLVVLGNVPLSSGFWKVYTVHVIFGAIVRETGGRWSRDSGIKCCKYTCCSARHADEQQVDGQAVLIHHDLLEAVARQILSSRFVCWRSDKKKFTDLALRFHKCMARIQRAF